MVRGEARPTAYTCRAESKRVIDRAPKLAKTCQAYPKCSVDNPDSLQQATPPTPDLDEQQS